MSEDDFPFKCILYVSPEGNFMDFFFFPTYICTGAHQVSSGEGLFTYHVDTRKVLCLDPGTVARICNPSAWEAD